MDTPKDICNKYCKQRIQRLTEDKPCPFTLQSSETEMEGEDLIVRTVCEGFIEHSFKTIIDRISKVTKKGIEIIKEKIKHEAMPRFGQWDESIKIPGINLPGSTGIPYGPGSPNINVPYTPPPMICGNSSGPWVYTTSVNSVKDSINLDISCHD